MRGLKISKNISPKKIQIYFCLKKISQKPHLQNGSLYLFSFGVKCVKINKIFSIFIWSVREVRGQEAEKWLLWVSICVRVSPWAKLTQFPPQHGSILLLRPLAQRKHSRLERFDPQRECAKDKRGTFRRPQCWPHSA